MARRLERLGEFLRENGLAAGAALVLAALLVLAVRWVAKSREAPAQKRVLQITGVIVRPEPPPAPKPPPPPPPPKEQPKEEEPQQQQTRLVEVKSTDIPPPDSPKPSGEPAAGPLALATEATGEGDVFNLVGNPGGRSVLAPGKIGEGGAGGGEGIGEREGEANANRYGWYFGRIASEIQGAFQRMKKTSTAQARVEIKIWVDPSGRVSRVQLLHSTGDEELDRAIESVAGLKLRESLPPDLPNPAVYRFTARRPQ